MCDYFRVCKNWWDVPTDHTCVERKELLVEMRVLLQKLAEARDERRKKPLRGSAWLSEMYKGFS